MGIFLAIFSFFNRFSVLARVIALLSILGGGFMYIKHLGAVSEQNEQNKAAITEVKKREKRENVNSRLSDSELDKRLRRFVQK